MKNYKYTIILKDIEKIKVELYRKENPLISKHLTKSKHNTNIGKIYFSNNLGYDKNMQNNNNNSSSRKISNNNTRRSWF
jgi:hypothetical protein